jgi:hypothetical protein
MTLSTLLTPVQFLDPAELTKKGKRLEYRQPCNVDLPLPDNRNRNILHLKEIHLFDISVASLVFRVLSSRFLVHSDIESYA